MTERIHATKVPMIEMEFDGVVYKFVYNLVAMNRISEMAREGVLPATEDVWNMEHVRCLVEATGFTHHPDEDWDDLLNNVSGGDLTLLSMRITQMIHEENEKAFADSASEGEALTEPTPEPAKRRRKASTG